MFKHRYAVLGATALLAGSLVGTYITKDGDPDPTPPEATLETVLKEFGDVSDMLKKAKEDSKQQYKDLTTHYAGMKEDGADLKKTVEQHTADYAALIEKTQSLQATLDTLKKELDAPIHKGGKELEEHDRKKAVELQRRIWMSKNPDAEAHTFKEDLDNLVDFDVVRGMARKLMRVGIESRKTIVGRFDDIERKHFEAASMDAGFFMPEMLGLEVDCNIECAQLVDLYDQQSVTRSKFMYPKIESYGDLGQYTCDAECDGPLGPEGNLRMLAGSTYDFRGVFCFQRKVLVEANYDLLAFMVRAAARSYRINRNQALITGDGINQPKGWLTADCFTKLKTPASTFNHQNFRQFLATAPVEYGPVVATMHQNMFAYLASMVDNNNRFIFGDGEMTYSPDDTSERIRISNCLPDATEGNTRGSTVNAFVAGAFIAAAGNWKMAYAAVSKSPLQIQQYEGGSTMWCVKYQFNAEDGGFVECCPAARTLIVG